ncbi:unnamed protein product [Stenotrophomonas maltophilia]|nr:hypothetical protein [Stenotrophomonas maltophilia]CRX69077.1 unnamed protein product [Stenotrophomonas maltophilia]
MYVVDYDPYFYVSLAKVFVEYGYDSSTAQDRFDFVQAQCESYDQFPHRLLAYDEILPGLKCTWCERNGRVFIYMAAIVDDLSKTVVFVAAAKGSLGRDEFVANMRLDWKP